MVRKIEDDENFDYEVIDGKRRLQASLMNRLTEIPIVLDTEFEDKKDLMVASLISNGFREDFSWLEKADGYKKLHDLGMTHEEIGKKVGLSRTRVTEYINTYEKWVDTECRLTDMLEMETTKEILNKCPEEDIPDLIKYVQENEVSVRDTRKILFVLRNFYVSLEVLKDFNPELHDELVNVYYPHRFNPKAIALYEKEKLLRTGDARLVDRFLDVKEFPTEESAKAFATKYHGELIGRVTADGWQVAIIPYTKAVVRYKLKELVE